MATIIRGFGHAAVTQSATNPDTPAAQAVVLTDGEGNIVAGGAGSVATPGVVRLEDGTSTNLATIQAFHNADNQALSGTSYGILTGGVAQAINPEGNLDRQRETGFDNVPGAGIVTGAQQMALPFSTNSGAGTITAGTRTITPAAMTGTVRGSTWTIQPGHSLSIDTGVNQEYLFVTGTTATTFTAVFGKAHAAAAALTGFVYNQARDASTPDGSPLTGFGGGMTYFLNTALNAGAGGVESERSAAGELDGASGTGTAIAAEYEHNSGGPVLASGLASGLQFDRARNLQGKGSQTQTITSTGAGNTSVVFGSAAATNLVQPGSPITLSGGAAQEVVYASATWTPGSSATVPVQSPVVNASQTLARFDVFAAQGPQLAGFTPYGIGIEEECLFDPVSGLYYVERSATQDSVSAQNVVLETPGLWNGASVDRQRGNLDTAALITASGATTTQTSADQTNFNGRGVKVVLNMTAAGTGSVTLSIQGKDAASGAYYTILAGVAVTTNTTNVYTVYPGAPAAANVSANDVLPRTWRTVCTANNANAASYTVGASVIV